MDLTFRISRELILKNNLISGRKDLISILKILNLVNNIKDHRVVARIKDLILTGT